MKINNKIHIYINDNYFKYSTSNYMVRYNLYDKTISRKLSPNIVDLVPTKFIPILTPVGETKLDYFIYTDVIFVNNVLVIFNGKVIIYKD